jgi:hypothetical protein
MSDDHASLLREIGEALGHPGPYLEILGELEDSISLGTMFSPPIGDHREVLGGARDPVTGHVAWVELRSSTPIDGYVPVAIDVRFAWGGGLRGEVVPYTYNPYFGVRIELARWYGERFVLLYREKHEMLLSYFDPPYEAQDRIEIDDDFIVDGDRVFYLDAGHLRGRVMPAMTETETRPIPRSEHGYRLWLERGGLARLALLPRFKSRETYDAAVAQACETAMRIELPQL